MLEKKSCKALDTSHTMADGMGDWRTFRDFITSGVQGITSSIGQPTREAHNCELKLTFISMVQLPQFGGAPMEDPNLNLLVLLEVCDTITLNGVSIDVICLCLFPFSLKDKHKHGSIHYVLGPSQLGMSSLRPFLTSSSHLARRQG